MSEQDAFDPRLSADQRDLPPGLHLKALVVAGLLLAAVAVLAIRYFL